MLGRKTDLLQALHSEIRARAGEGQGHTVPTIYFGGGTPSILSLEEIADLLALIREEFPTSPDTEITLEANPDDLERSYLAGLREIGIQRLSIGVQSFRDEDLRSMNRSHDAAQARQCLHDARAEGFASLNADLIYGIPGAEDEHLLENIRELLRAEVDHISAYALTVEPRTALDHFVRSGKAPAPSDEQTVRQFQLLREQLLLAGFEHYEISNWARPGRYSRHNISYWQGLPYLGFGPAAHSYDGVRRSWNVANNARYIRAWEECRRDAEEEILQPHDHYNEYVLTRLRTRWGCRPVEMAPEFRAHFLKEIEPYIARGWVRAAEGAFILTDAGEAYADGISAALFAEPA